MRLNSFGKQVQNKDYLIVGQGIAGSLLGHELIKRDKTVSIINQTSASSSSRVAAGLYNPITGRKMVKTWNCDRLFAILEDYYTDLELLLGVKFLRKTGIYRPFFSVEEQNDWQGKVEDEKYKYLVGDIRQSQSENAKIIDPFGGLMLKKAGYVDLNVLLDAFREYFIKKGCYAEARFETAEMEFSGGVSYGGCHYNKIIFCDSTDMQNHTWFNWLPMRPVKGEVLDIQTEEYGEEMILNRGVFLAPLKNNVCRVGATYDNNDLSLTPTQQAVENLSKKLNLIFSGQVDILSHKVGIRPATKDRRPFIGIHPSNKFVGIFNGLGTKGISLAAYYSQQFADFLVGKKALDEEVNISRFFSLNSTE